MERQWEQQQEEQHESLVKRSQIFMKRWTMRSHLSKWRQVTAAASAERLQGNMSALAAEHEGLSVQSQQDRERLLDEKQQLESKHGVLAQRLSADLKISTSKVQELSSALSTLESRHETAVSEASRASAQVAALGKQADGMSHQIAEQSALLAASQSSAHGLTEELHALTAKMLSHESRAEQVEEELLELQRSHGAVAAQLSAKSVECLRLAVELAEVHAEMGVAHASVGALEEQLNIAQEDGEEREHVLAEYQTATLPALRAHVVDVELKIKALSEQIVAAHELQQYSKKEAAMREESNAQAWAATKEARATLLTRDTTIRQLNLDLSDNLTNVERLEHTQSSLRKALQKSKDTVAEQHIVGIAAHEERADLQARREEDSKRIASLRDDNVMLHKEKSALDDAIQSERNEMRVLRQRLSEFDERSKDLESIVEREQAEINRQRAARKETEKHNTALMAKQVEIEKAYKAREAAAVKALSEQLQRLKDTAREQLEDVTASCSEKVDETAAREREARNALVQCQVELRKLVDERKSLQTRTSTAENEAERLQTELRVLQESEKSLESELKVLRRESARVTEQCEAAEKAGAVAVSKADGLHTKLRQVEAELKEKAQELESAMLGVDRVQNELIHERRLTHAARTQGENMAKELQLLTAKLSEEKQKTRELQNQLSDCERRVSILSSDLEATVCVCVCACVYVFVCVCVCVYERKSV